MNIRMMTAVGALALSFGLASAASAQNMQPGMGGGMQRGGMGMEQGGMSGGGMQQGGMRSKKMMRSRKMMGSKKMMNRKRGM